MTPQGISKQESIELLQACKEKYGRYKIAYLEANLSASHISHILNPLRRDKLSHQAANKLKEYLTASAI